jgi:WD40 repeat protein
MRQDEPVMGAWLSNDGNRILSATNTGVIQVWDATTTQKVGAPARIDGTTIATRISAAFDHDGAPRILFSSDNVLHAWDLATRSPIGAAMQHDSTVWGARFSDSRTRILSWSSDTVRLWDARTGRPIGAPMKHDNSVWGAIFSPDETRVMSWSADGTIRLWDSQTGAQMGRSMYYGEGGASGASNNAYATFNKDGTRIVSTATSIATGRGLTGSIRLWDVATTSQIGMTMIDEHQVGGAIFHSNDSQILSWSYDEKHDRSTIRYWSIPWVGKNLFEIACNRSPPDHDLSEIGKRYGVRITDPVCQYKTP